MAKIREQADCKTLRLFLWNEKLTRNQISQSEGLCVFIINSTFIASQPCEDNRFEYTSTTKERQCSTVIPFDLSKLLNKDASLSHVLVSATLQFEPQTTQKLANDISECLFTEFQDSQALLPAPRPIYVIAIEISQTRHVNFDDNVDFNVSPNLRGLPPLIPFYRWFEIHKVFTVYNVSAADYKNDPYDTYTDDVVEYLNILREYTGEGGVFPTKPPIATDIARGFVEVKPCQSSWCASPAISLEDLMDDTFPVCQDEFEDKNEVIATYSSHAFHTRCLLPWLSKKNTCPTCPRSWCPGPAYCLEDLIDDTCPVCQDEFKDENEVIVTYCSHAFHTRCLLPWLSKKNTCPTCRAVYPLHYSPSLDRQCRKRKHNMLEASD